MRKDAPVYLPVEEHIREILKKRKGILTYSEFLRNTFEDLKEK